MSSSSSFSSPCSNATDMVACVCGWVVIAMTWCIIVPIITYYTYKYYRYQHAPIIQRRRPYVCYCVMFAVFTYLSMGLPIDLLLDPIHFIPSSYSFLIQGYISLHGIFLLSCILWRLFDMHMMLNYARNIAVLSWQILLLQLPMVNIPDYKYTTEIIPQESNTRDYQDPSLPASRRSSRKESLPAVLLSVPAIIKLGSDLNDTLPPISSSPYLSISNSSSTFIHGHTSSNTILFTPIQIDGNHLMDTTTTTSHILKNSKDTPTDAYLSQPSHNNNNNNNNNISPITTITTSNTNITQTNENVIDTIVNGNGQNNSFIDVKKTMTKTQDNLKISLHLCEEKNNSIIPVSNNTLPVTPPSRSPLEKSMDGYIEKTESSTQKPMEDRIHENQNESSSEKENGVISHSRYIRWKNTLGNPRKNVWIFVISGGIMACIDVGVEDEQNDIWLLILLALHVTLACVLWCRIPKVSDIFYIRREIQYIIAVGAYTCAVRILLELLFSYESTWANFCKIVFANMIPATLLAIIQVVLVNYWINKDKVDMNVRQNGPNDSLLTVAQLHLPMANNSNDRASHAIRGGIPIKSDNSLRRQQLKHFTLFQLLCYTLSNLDATTVFFNRLAYEYSIENGLALIEFIQFYHWCSDTFHKQWRQYILSKNLTKKINKITASKKEEEEEEEEDDEDEEEEEKKDSKPEKLAKYESIDLDLERRISAVKPSVVNTPETMPMAARESLGAKTPLEIDLELESDMNIIVDFEKEITIENEKQIDAISKSTKIIGNKENKIQAQLSPEKIQENEEADFVILDETLMTATEKVIEIDYIPEIRPNNIIKARGSIVITTDTDAIHGHELQQLSIDRFMVPSISTVQEQSINAEIGKDNREGTPNNLEYTKIDSFKEASVDTVTNELNDLHQAMDQMLANSVWRDKISRIRFSPKIPLSKINRIKYKDHLYLSYYPLIQHNTNEKEEFNSFFKVCQMKYRLLYYKYLRRNAAEYELNIPASLACECEKLDELINYDCNVKDFINTLIPIMSKIISGLLDLLNDSMRRFRATHDFQTKMHKFEPEN